MMKAKNYAQALTLALAGKKNDEAEACVTNFLAILKRRGHTSLLPQIVKVLETEEGRASIVGRLKLARMSDRERFQENIKHDASRMNVDAADLEVLEHDDLVGGYMLETRDKLTDRTYKRKLLGLYRELTL